MALNRTTELDAINAMLGTIGESPINSLEGVSGVGDAVTARQVLNEVAVQVLEKGWHFNTEKNFTLAPTTSGEILVPNNALEIDTSGYDKEVDVAIRGNKLWNRTDQTFVFSKPLKCDVVFLLEFEEMPQAARHYVMVRAARIFQQRTVGSETLTGFTQKDEAEAKTALMLYEARTADHNILRGNYGVMRVIDR